MNDEIMKEFLRHSARGIAALALLLMLFALASCSPKRTVTKVVEIPGETVVLRDTLRVNGSTNERDSTYQSEKTETRGDTVYHTLYKYRERTRRDTLREEVIVEKPVEVPKPYPVEVERKEPLFPRLLKSLGVLALGFCAGYVAKIIRR